MSLLKLLFPILFLTGTLLSSAHAEEQLSLSTSLHNIATPLTTAPLTLSTARNVQLVIIQSDDPQNGDLLQRVRNGFAMNELNDPLIAKHEQWYASRPEYVARTMSRARLYLYYITNEVERRGMPSEIALLPFIESAYNPIANSTSSAAGIWQFIPSTGKHFGLQQNWWYDGRRDIISATTSALDYLEKLHDMFGDWELALAAYNWGEGSVSRAQERNRKRGLPTDYASLQMPDETRNYVPKLLAVKNIIANPEKFGLYLPPIANEPYFASVSTAKHIDVKLAAQLADITKEEFIALNPAHNRPVILQSNSDYILLPVDKIEDFLDNLEKYEKPLVSWQAYQTKKGENISNLAPRFGVSVERLMQANGMSSHSHLSSGDTLLVPLNNITDDEEGQFAAFNMELHPFQTSSSTSNTHSIQHTVRRGETLSKIARRYCVSLDNLKSWNSQARNVQAGQKLTIFQTVSSDKASAKTSRSASHKHSKASSRQVMRHNSSQHAVKSHNQKVKVAYQNR